MIARDRQGRLVGDLQRDELQVFEDGKRCEIRSFRGWALRHRGEGARDRANTAGHGSPLPRPGRRLRPRPRAARTSSCCSSRRCTTNRPRASARPLSNSWTAASRRAPGSHCTGPTVWAHGCRSRSRTQERAAAPGRARRDRQHRRGPHRPDRRQQGRGHPGPRGPPATPAAQPRPRCRRSTRRVGREQRESRGRAHPGPPAVRHVPGDPGDRAQPVRVRGRKAIVYFAVDHQARRRRGQRRPGEPGLRDGHQRRQPRERHRAHRRRARAPVRKGGRPLGVGPGMRRRSRRRDSGGARPPVSPGPQPPRRRGMTRARCSAIPSASPACCTPRGPRGSSRSTAARCWSTWPRPSGRPRDQEHERPRRRAGAGHGRAARGTYEVVYTPPNPVRDGRFRTIQARTTRPGVRVRTRAGYFATPAAAAPPAADPRGGGGRRANDREADPTGGTVKRAILVAVLVVALGVVSRAQTQPSLRPSAPIPRSCCWTWWRRTARAGPSPI